MTEFDRADLVGRLKTVSAALRDKDILSQLTCFWFTGKTVMAYNDQIAVSVPLETDFEGTVPGKPLLGLVSSLQSKSVTMEELKGEGSVLLSAGKASQFKLPIGSKACFIFEMPKIGRGVKKLDKDATDALISRISGCMRSVSAENVLVDDRRGLTVIPNGSTVDLYATNEDTISMARLSADDLPCKKRALLPAPFCQELLNITESATELRLEVTDEHVLAVANDVTLFGRFRSSERQYDFAKVISQHFNKETRKQMVDIPEKLARVVERAEIISGDSKAMNVLVTGKQIQIQARSNYGSGVEKLKLVTSYKDVSADFVPEHVLTGLESFTQIFVAENSMLMTNEEADEIYLISRKGKVS